MTEEITNIFKEKIIIKHYELHGTWPKCNVENLHKYNPIRVAYTHNAPFPQRATRYQRRDLSFLSFEKTFNINQKLNPAEMMSDNSLSLCKTELIQAIIKDMSIGKSTDKAVVVQWLMSDLSDPEEFLRLISEKGFEEEEQVFGVCGKERELKIYARFFGLSTLLKRMYIVITEAILASVFLKYFPEITMMDDSLTLLKKFHLRTRSMNSKAGFDERVVVTNVDFEKWNSHMRKGETDGIFSCFDQLIGIPNLYVRTHEMFTNSIMYLADGSYIPEVDPKTNNLKLSDIAWVGHLGGIEGLRQKGWTIFTVCVLYKVMEQMEVKFTLMGQGDNQVMLCSYSSTLSDNEISTRHARLIDVMAEVLAKVGPPLKKEETWSSSRLFIYGKYPILEGAPMSVSLKKMCRMMTHSNEGFPTLETSISSIASNASAACISDFDPLVSMYAYFRESTLCFKTHLFQSYLGADFRGIMEQARDRGLLRFKCDSTNLDSSCDLDASIHAFDLETKTGERQQRLEKIVNTIEFQVSPLLCHILGSLYDFIKILLIFPRCLGGYPVISFFDLMFKGFPDPLTSSLSHLYLLHQISEPWVKEMIQNIIDVPINPGKNYAYLFEDPVSLNLLHPSSPSDTIKKYVFSFLQSASWVKNPYFKEFFPLALRSQDPLIIALSSMEPLNPIIGHMILEATILGKAAQVLGQLNKTDTMAKLTMVNGGIDLREKVIKSENEYFISLLHHLGCKGSLGFEKECSRVKAQQLREIGWGSSSITGVTVACPFETFQIQSGNLCDSHSNKEIGYVLLKGKVEIDNPYWVQGIKIGRVPPYLGSSTSVKVKSYGRVISRNSSPILSSAAKLQTLIG